MLAAIRERKKRKQREALVKEFTDFLCDRYTEVHALGIALGRARPMFDGTVPVEAHLSGLKDRLEATTLDELVGSNQAELVEVYRAIHDAFDRHDLIDIHRLAAIPKDVNRINQIEVIIDLYNLKLERTRTDPERQRRLHTFVVGRTGVGKSVLLHNLIRHYLVWNKKPSLVLFDPHGDLARSVTRDRAFRRNDRLVYINLNGIAGQHTHLNPFELVKRTEQSLNRAQLQFSGAVEQIIGQSFTPVQRTLIRACLGIMLHKPGLTLVDLVRLLQDEQNVDLLRHGQEYLPNAIDRQFFTSTFGKSHYRATKQALVARLTDIVRDPYVRRFTCHKSSFNLGQVLDSGKVLVVCFDPSKQSPDTIRTIGQLLNAAILSHVLGRTPYKRQPIHLFVDECQYFVSPTIDTHYPADDGPLDRNKRQTTQSFSVHPSQTCQCQANHTQTSGQLNQRLGQLVGTAARRLCGPFIATNKGNRALPRWRTRSRFVQGTGAQIRSLNDGISGHNCRTRQPDDAQLGYDEWIYGSVELGAKAAKNLASSGRFWYNFRIVTLILMSIVPPFDATAQSSEARDCVQLRIDNGWSRTEFRECRRLEIQRNIDRLDAEFAEMRDWLRARGLDVNDAGHITDPQGRTLAQIEASNADLSAGNADLATGNADLATGNAALRAEIGDLRLSIQTSRAKYREILQDFERDVLGKN